METRSQTGVLLALLCSAEVWYEKPMFYLPSTKQLAEDVSTLSRLLSREWEESSSPFTEQIVMLLLKQFQGLNVQLLLPCPTGVWLW